MRITLSKEVLKQAVDSEDWQTVSAVTDHLRFKSGYSHDRVMEIFAAAGADPADVERLLELADHMEARGANQAD